jgi:hypothetical protein
MQHRHTRRALLLTALAGTGCLGRSRPGIEVRTDLRGRPFQYHSRCCDWEGTTVKGFLPAVFDALGAAISREVMIGADGEQTGLLCAMTPARPDDITLLNGFYTVVLPMEAQPATVLVPEPLDTAGLRAALATVTDAVPRQVEIPVDPPRGDAAVVTDWVTAYRWARRDRGRLVDAAGGPIGAFTPSIIAVGQAAVTLQVADPSVETTIRTGLRQLRQGGRLGAIRAEYFYASGRPRRL